MNIVYDGKFCYRSPSDSQVGWCHLQVLQGKTHCLLLATELPDNPGLPIRNAVLHIWKQAITLFGLDQEKLQYILHYPVTSGKIEYSQVRIAYKDLSNFPNRLTFDGQSRLELGEVNAILEAL